jgi:hypothetical protein
MTRKQERFESIERAKRCGLTEDDAIAVRRIALTLRRWFELECGSDQGCIERDEKTGIPYFWRHNHRYLDPHDPRARQRIPDREAEAQKRLDKLMAAYPHLRAFIQTDPRGGTIYLCKPEEATDSLYTRGVFIA